MNDTTHKDDPTLPVTCTDANAPGISRRTFLGNAALLGLTGTGLAASLVGCKEGNGPQAPASAPASAPSHASEGLSYEIKPGQLDEYYGLWSGGHSGEMRVLGVPSGREIKRIPVFNTDALTGWGLTNESKQVMGTNPDGSLRYTTGDTHHVHASYEDGTYDGKYAWVNDKVHSRLGRVRLDTMECDKITELPNVQGFHGIFPDRRDPVDPAINHTTRVFCGSEFALPHPNDGENMDDPEKYYSLFTCVDAETMEVRWQCRVDGNMDLVASSYDGKLAASNQYNTENGMIYAEMMSAEHDSCVFFNIERIEAAVKAGNSSTLSNSNVPIVDGRKAVEYGPEDRAHLLCADTEKSTWRECQPGWQILHLFGQAVTDGLGD